MKILLVYPNLQLISLLPSNIGIFTALLKQSGHDVKLFDTTLYKTTDKSVDEIRVEYGHYKSTVNTPYYNSNVFSDFKTLLHVYTPDIVAFSVVDSTWKLTKQLLDCIDIKTHTILGGVFPTFAPDIAISHKNVNSICIGEGEGALLDLCYNLDNPIGIKNLWVKGDSIIYKSKLRNLVDINTLPYEDFTIFPENRFFRPMQGKDKKMLPIMIDRGCPYKCQFCAEPSISDLYSFNNLGKSYRIKTIDNIKQYLKYMVSTYNPEYLYFNTETFFALPISLISDFSKYYKSEINLPFCCMTRFDTITKDRAKILKDMGCDRLSLGLEHGNEKFRSEILHKPFSNDTVINSIQILKEYDIPASIFTIVGFPDETPELAKDTISLCQKIYQISNKSTFSISIFQPYYSSPLRKYCIEKNYINVSDKGGNLIEDTVLNMKVFPKEEIKEYVKTFIKNVTEQQY